MSKQVRILFPDQIHQGKITGGFLRHLTWLNWLLKNFKLIFLVFLKMKNMKIELMKLSWYKKRNMTTYWEKLNIIQKGFFRKITL